MGKYVLGVDFGTLSARALVVEASTGRELAAATMDYPHAVMDERLPDGTPLPPDWALQHPADYLNCLAGTIPEALARSGVDAGDVIGVGIDFTACTMLPIDQSGTPLCLFARVGTQPPRLHQALEAPRGAGRGQPLKRNRRRARRGVFEALRRQDLLRVDVPQDLADSQRGARGIRSRRPLHRGRRLGGHAVNLQGGRAQAAWPATRRCGTSATATRPRTSSPPSTSGCAA